MPSPADRVSREEIVDALKLAYSCLLEVRRDFGAPINNVIAEVKAVLSAATSVRQEGER